jgi:glycosyltransferase involved in cell wall biosynthesis
MSLSILICHLPKRRLYLQRLLDTLDPQIVGFKVSIHADADKHLSIGAKRNRLLQKAEGEYVCFIDDDDRISDNYISLLMEGINKGVDCCSLQGIITEDGNNPLLFEHSIKYNAYKTNPDNMHVRYERYPNHLNCIKSSIAKQFTFPEKNHSEDTEWATAIFKAGVLRTEHQINEVIYHYDYRSRK